MYKTKFLTGSVVVAMWVEVLDDVAGPTGHAVSEEEHERPSREPFLRDGAKTPRTVHAAVTRGPRTRNRGPVECPLVVVRISERLGGVVHP